MTQPPTDPVPIDTERAALAVGLRHHRAGELTLAASAYRRVLAKAPTNADALHLLGLVAHAQGWHGEALALIDQALAVQESARYHANRGMVLSQIARYAEAELACRQAIAHDPTHADAFNTLGMARLAQGDAADATHQLRAAIVLRPDYPEAHANLGNALAAQERLAEAEVAFRAALASRPTPTAGRRILFVYSDPSQPGHIYRCVRMAEAACDAGWDARAVAVSDLVDVDIIGLTLLIFWRFELTPSVCRLVALARAGGASVGLDLDDLVFDPMLARSEVIDGMRSMGMTNADVRLHFFGVQKFLLETDFGLCTTKELANQMRRTGKPIWVIPNGFDQATHDAARIAMRARPNDGLLRIGYAAGTKTHQRDLQVAAPALGRILAAYPAARLVLFRQASDGAHFIGLEEMPALAAVGAQIEWRTQVALADLPSELARFDINIAPLEVGNPFVEAKSELKFFEAALVEVPTIASPTGPFRRAIRDGVTGVLADSDAAWAAALRTLLNNAGQRSRMGSAAYRDAIVRFGPDARGKVIKAALLAIVAASAR